MFELSKVGVMASFLKRSYKYKPQPSEQQPIKRIAFSEHPFKSFSEILNNHFQASTRKKKLGLLPKANRKGFQRVCYLFRLHALYALSALKELFLYSLV